MPAGAGPCAKQTVVATIVAADGTRYSSSNYTMRPQAACPRAGMATGEGYELCKSVCEQPGHAETNAIRLAGPNARGGTLYLEGHTYACGPCALAAVEAGILGIKIGSPPKERP